MREQLSKRKKAPVASQPKAKKQAPKSKSVSSAKASASRKLTAKARAKKTAAKTPVAIKKGPAAKPKVKKAERVASAKPAKSVKATKKAAARPAIKAAKTRKSAKSAKAVTRATRKPAKTRKTASFAQISPSPAVVNVAPAVPRRQIASQALRAFEQAVKVFNLREYSEAKALFEELQQRFQQEVEIISRSQTYIQICSVRLAKDGSLPRNADEFYDRGVVALNIGNFVQARTFFEKALKLRPEDSHTLYSLAATHAQTGSAEQALSYLEKAVQKQPRLRQRALNDADFSVLKEDRRFLELLGATSPFDLLEARRDMS